MILVTGSTGYIGSRLVQHLLSEGIPVRGLVLPNDIGLSASLASIGMEIWLGDLLKPDSLHGITKGVGIVYHLAGIHAEPLSIVRQLYVDGTHHLINELKRESSIRCCVVASNSAVYGDGGERWLFESGPTEPSTHPFGQITAEMEELVCSEFKNCGLPAIILRIADVYGPHPCNPIKRLQERRIRLVGEGSSWTSHIHIADLLNILCIADNLHLGEIYNVSDDLPVRAQQFYSFAAEIGRAPVPTWIAREGVSSRVWHGVHGLRSLSARITNVKLRSQLGYQLQYPTYKDGLWSLTDHFIS